MVSTYLLIWNQSMEFQLNSLDDVDFIIAEVLLICHPPSDSCVSLFTVLITNRNSALFQVGTFPIRAVISVPVGLRPHGFRYFRYHLPATGFCFPYGRLTIVDGLYQAYQVELLLDAYGLGYPFTPADIWVAICASRQARFPICNASANISQPTPNLTMLTETSIPYFL